MPLKRFHDLVDADDRYAVALSEGKVYIALFPWNPYSFDLRCLDARTGEELWTSSVWALDLMTVAPGGTTGTADHVVTLDIKDRTIFVWGGDGRGMYVESFSLEGKALCRFSTNLWSIADE